MLYCYSIISINISMNLQQCKQLWNKLKQQQIKSNIGLGSYKINKYKYLGRGGFGIVYAGLLKQSQDIIKQVAIKQFKLSEHWKNKDDHDQQLIILQRFQKIWDYGYHLKMYEILRAPHNKRYYLITQYCQGGNLTQQIKYLKDWDIKIHELCLRIADILRYLHYDLLANFKSKGKDLTVSDRNVVVGIIHRDVKPANILFVRGKNCREVYLMDFGIAMVTFTQQLKPHTTSGTSLYKAPELFQTKNDGVKKFNAKVDIWSFGATLFQILNGGQRLFTNVSAHYGVQEKKKVLQQRLRWLQSKMQNGGKGRWVDYWMKVLRKCLEVVVGDRWNSLQLYTFLNNNKFNSIIPQHQGRFTQNNLLLQTIKKHIQYQLNFQTFKLIYLQDKIFTLFHYISCNPNRINRFTLYVILKYLTNYIMERGGRLKEKAKICNMNKYTYYKKVIDEKKIQEIKRKCTDKIRREVRNGDYHHGDDYHQYAFSTYKQLDVIESYPEILAQPIRESRKLLYQFIYSRRAQILSDDTFSSIISGIASALDDIDQLIQMNVTEQQWQTVDVELLSMMNVGKFIKFLEGNQKKENVKTVIYGCRVEHSRGENVNKMENQNDLLLEPK